MPECEIKVRYYESEKKDVEIIEHIIQGKSDPQLIKLLPEINHNKFILLKVSRGTSTASTEIDKDEFELIKLTYDEGKIFYDGEQLIDIDNNYSFYWWQWSQTKWRALSFPLIDEVKIT